MKFKSLVVLSVLALTACNKQSKEGTITEDTKSEQAVVTQREMESKTFSVKDLGSPVQLSVSLDNLELYSRYINHHVLSVVTPRAAYPGTIECRKKVIRNYEKPTKTLISPSHETRIVLEVEPRDPDKVFFKCVVLNKQGEMLESFEKTYKRNLVISRTIPSELVDNKDLDTLIINEGGEILTNGKDINIKANRLISLNGKITTFTDNEVFSTPDMKAGKDGGLIQMVINEAQGNLAINLRGTNGGKQLEVPIRPPQAPAGHSGSCSRRHPNCDGGKGAKGYPANEGFQGLPGGSSGAAYVNVLTKSDFEVSFIYDPGLGSEGSKASEPGLGGPGGTPGSVLINDCSHAGSGTIFSPSSVSPACAYVIEGSYGPQGDLGERAKDGAQGETGRSEISQFSNYEEGQAEKINASWSNLKGYL